MGEEKDKKGEQDIIKGALKICGYPEWLFRTVKEKVANKEKIKKGKNDNKKKSTGMVVLPCMKCVSEKLEESSSGGGLAQP